MPVGMTTLNNILLTSFVAVLTRWCISLNGYSGAGKSPMYGDYEAQRHWMEITVNLPVKEWYKNSTDNDLMYWGLDYPPLTAYHSMLCGLVAKKINPQWISLYTSRGFESYTHKLFMRYSVLLVDLLIFFPAVFLYFFDRRADTSSKLISSFLMLMYPGLILIDHGHFQYNCISLGFTLWAVLLLCRGHDLFGSIFFCLALNYKQMELYHALPFFCYLLGICLKSKDQNGFFRLMKIGMVVVATFGLCWLPYLSDIASALQVLHRLFPFARGLYEDKVANVWCSLSILIKFKQILTVDKLISLCLGSTLLFLLPSSIDLLIRPNIEKFKLSLINSSLVFFLFSFQVHEKSIIIVALVVCLQILDRPFWCIWFSIISTFSMLPLLIKDGLLVPTIATIVLFTVLSFSSLPVFIDQNKKYKGGQKLILFQKFVFIMSVIGAVLLMVAMVTLKPPPRLPDLYPVLISAYSCAHFLLFLAYFHIQQFQCNATNITVKKLQ